MPDSIFASRVLQILTWILFLPTLLINLLLILSIRRERRTDNRFRWFNSMFLFSTYSNTLLLLLFTAFQPVILPARRLIYLVFIGPVAWILPRFLLRLLYCTIVGVASYQIFISPISLFLRWLVVTKRISCMKLSRNLIAIYYGLSAVPLSVLSLIFLHIPGLQNPENEEELDSEAVAKLTGSDYGFIAVKLVSQVFLSAFITPYHQIPALLNIPSYLLPPYHRLPNHLPFPQTLYKVHPTPVQRPYRFGLSQLLISQFCISMAFRIQLFSHITSTSDSRRFHASEVAVRSSSNHYH